MSESGFKSSNLSKGPASGLKYNGTQGKAPFYGAVFMPFERCELLATIKYTTSETLEGHVKQPNKMEVFVVYHFLESLVPLERCEV